MIRSNFSVCIDGGVFVVIDLNNGATSVTNDIENVVAFLGARIDGRPMVYRDSEGHWDGVIIKDGKFHDFRLIGARSQSGAVSAARLLRARGDL